MVVIVRMSTFVLLDVLVDCFQVLQKTLQNYSQAELGVRKKLKK